MPERNRSFEGIVLRLRDTPTGDRIATFLEPSGGLVDAFVFGGPKSSLRASASPFVLAKVFVYEDPVRHSAKLTDISILESFSGLRDRYASLWAASALAEFIVKTHACGGEQAAVLRLGVEALRALAAAPSDEAAESTLLACLWKLLDIMGLRPDTELCSSCGRQLISAADRGPAAGAALSPDGDGFLCGACAYPDSERLSAAALARLARFHREDVRTSGTEPWQDGDLASARKLVFDLARNAAEGNLVALFTAPP